MRKVCGSCGAGFEARRASAKYCSERCKKRAQRAPGHRKTPRVAPLPVDAPAVVAGSLTAATEAELDQAGRIDTAVGQAALVLARRIDHAASETGSALASLVREHRATLAEALADVQSAADPLDELRTRRERKLAGG
jgi:hypothetical protein